MHALEQRARQGLRRWVLPLLLALGACATDEGSLRGGESPQEVEAQVCESVSGPARAVLEAGGRQVVRPSLPRHGPVQVSQAEFERAMRLLAAQLPKSPQPFLQRPGKAPQLAAASHLWHLWQRSPCAAREGALPCSASGEPVLHLGEEERADMALMFAFESLWPGVQAAVEASVEPQQLRVAVYSTLSIYLGLLLLPEPTSKLIALALTVTLVAYVGADTLFNLVEGYRHLTEEARHARSFHALRVAGERYGHVMGEQVGRILVMLATAALGWNAHGVMKGPGLPGLGRAAQLLKAETGLELSALARQVQAVAVARPAVTVVLTPAAAYMAEQGMEGSQGVHASAPASSGAGPAPRRHRLERVEEWRKPKLTEDGRVLPYKGTRTPPEPIVNQGRSRAGKTVTNGKDTVRFDRDGFAEFETKFETKIDDIHIGSGRQPAPA